MSRPYSLGLYEKAMPSFLGWEEMLSTAKEIGYDYVELSIDQSEERLARLNFSEEEILELVTLSHRLGMPFGSMSVSALTKYSLGHPVELMSEHGLYIGKKAVLLAKKLGISVVMIPGYDVFDLPSTPESKVKFAYNLNRLVEFSAQHGVIIALETMENQFMNTVWKALSYVKTIQSPYLKIYPDTGNLCNAAQLEQHDMFEDLRHGKGYITSLHLKESLPQRFREIPFGEGHVPFERCIKTAWDMGVRRYVTELWDVGLPSWKEEIIRTYQYVNGILE